MQEQFPISPVPIPFTTPDFIGIAPVPQIVPSYVNSKTVRGIVASSLPPSLPPASERGVVHRKFKWYPIFAALATATAFIGGMIATPFLLSPLVGIFALKLPNIIRPDNISSFCFNLPHLNFDRDEHLAASILHHPRLC